jgi:hypothetical protein
MTTLTLPQEVWEQEIKEKTEPAADWSFVARPRSSSWSDFGMDVSLRHGKR